MITTIVFYNYLYSSTSATRTIIITGIYTKARIFISLLLSRSMGSGISIRTFDFDCGMTRVG